MKSVPPHPARRVIRWIRKNIPRPDQLPCAGHLTFALRWDKRCPLALAKNATALCPDPEEAREWVPLHSYAIGLFMEWWDSLREEEAEWAMRMVWGKKKNLP